MAFRLFPPFVQFFNDSGEVLNGGSITFTNSGTTTPKATYSNKALSIENTNPVLLDSSGRPETDIWGSGSYRAVLKDALGALATLGIGDGKTPFSKMDQGTLEKIANDWTTVEEKAAQLRGEGGEG